MNRDCCEGLECNVGDWSVTTDSTCLSKRSQRLEDLSDDKKVNLIVGYYASLSLTSQSSSSSNKTPQEAKELALKHRYNFAKLVVRLEKKYGIPLKEEYNVDSSSSSKEDL
eukprot:CAMPEP_0118706928 /NCGR_PEP_ID=MMETSP0800-20121206/20879_1 /TAXON_ID=210618 ORGANISM="Striatella unipunctata, Strain CCMP2910" /NCGR_SAMPLE_ID=MMETSP0800 /ASSEMBLY_ACC=CAM_ASM_000638 /LENGTH=110 /DNA_ID=CAMNT_0006609615 /DNA_START=101 /DNA_END=433 /DNA_ORIENTATION=-